MFSLFGDFHKRNKERKVAAKERRILPQLPPVCLCRGEEEAPREGPSGQGEGSPRRKGANRKLHHPGRREGIAEPLLGSPPKQSPWYPVAGRRRAGLDGGGVRDLSRIRVPRKSKDLSRTAQFLGQHEAVI